MTDLLKSHKTALAGLATILILITIGIARFGTDASAVITMKDGPLYETAEQLATDSDVIALVRVLGVIGRYEDWAGDPRFDERGDPIPPLKKIVVDVEVADVLKGDVDSKRIAVVMADTGGVDDQWTPTLRAGETVVLHLFDVPAELGSQEVQAQDRAHGGLFGLVGGRQGVFDVKGPIATSRSDTHAISLDLPTG